VTKSGISTLEQQEWINTERKIDADSRNYKVNIVLRDIWNQRGALGYVCQRRVQMAVRAVRAKSSV
jgi:hypothetical protein